MTKAASASNLANADQYCDSATNATLNLANGGYSGASIAFMAIKA